MHNGHRSRAFLGRVAPFAVQKTLEEQNTPCCCCFAFACSGRRRSWATTTLDLLSPSVVMAQTAWSKRWIKPEASFPSQLSGSLFFPLLFFPRKKKTQNLLPHFVWFLHLRCRPRGSCSSSAGAVVFCHKSSPALRLVFPSAVQNKVFFFVCRLLMRSFFCLKFSPVFRLVFHVRWRPRSSCFPSADAVVVRSDSPSAVQTKEFLFAVCRCGRLSVWFSVCGADQGVLVCRLLMRSFSGLNLLPHLVWFSICAAGRGVLVFRLLMRSFVCLLLFLST